MERKKRRLQHTETWPDKKDYASRAACLTTFDSVPDRLTKYMAELPKTFTYFVGQMETCPETGRLHLQMYAEFTNPKTISAIKKCLNDTTMHVEHRRGTPKQASDYCKDPDTAVQGTQWEHGELNNQGKRNDLGKVIEQVQAGASLREVALDNPTEFIKFNRGITAYAAMAAPRGRTALTVTWIWGDPCTLKTDSIARLHGAENIGNNVDEKWFNYEGQDVIVYEEVKPELFTHHHQLMLRWLDEPFVELPVKGGFTPRRAKHIYLTSNWDPMTVLLKAPAILRRIHVIEERRILTETATEVDARRHGTLRMGIAYRLITPTGEYSDMEYEGTYILDQRDWTLTPEEEYNPNREPLGESDRCAAEKARVAKRPRIR